MLSLQQAVMTECWRAGLSQASHETGRREAGVRLLLQRAVGTDCWRVDPSQTQRSEPARGRLPRGHWPDMSGQARECAKRQTKAAKDREV